MTKRFRSNLTLGLSLAVLLALLLAPLALADNIVNDITASSGNVTINVGESTNVGYKINMASAGDPQQGCNASDGTPATIALSVPNNVTASANSLTFNACNVFQYVTFSSSTAGTYAINVSSFFDAGGGGYKNQANFTLSVLGSSDTTQPVVTVPVDITAEATGPSGAAVTFTASAADLVDGAITPTCTPSSGSTFALGTTTVTCSATDSHGNTGSKSFAVTVQDTTAPVIAAHADVIAEATSAAGAAVSYTSPTTSDAVDGAGTATCAPASGSTFGLGVTTVTCSATDKAGNVASPTTFKITVQDTIAPVIASHADVIAEATSASGAVVSYTSPATSDAVDGAGTASCAPASVGTFPLGDTTVTCNAQDAAGNPAISTTFKVTVRDTTPPAVTVPADMTAEATGPSGAAVTFTASATDLVDGSVAVTCAPASGSTFALGITAVSCSATDAHSNTGTGTFKVTVQDTTPPAVTVPADMTVEATGPSGAVVTFTASAADLVDGAITPTCAPASGSTFSLGTATVTCSATDAHGNTGSSAFKVTVQDTTPPAVTVPADMTAEATGPAGAAVTFTASAVDLVDGSVAVTCAPASGSTFALGTTAVSCSATDAHSNTGTGTFNVTIRDTTPPVIASHADVTAEATSAAGAVVSYTSPATSDAVDGAGTATCTPATGSTFPLGDTTVTCSATDKAGNVASPTTFKVTVQDTTPPVIAPHADVTVEATGVAGAVVNFTYPATSDAVDGPGTAICTPASGSTFPFGATTVTCNAQDAAGNKAVPTTFKVTVTLQLKGFYQPVDMTPVDGTTVWNTVKNGSTVPLKFEVFAGPTELTDISVVSAFSKQVTCNAGAEDTVEVLATGGTSLRYDSVAGQFIFNWQTPKLPGKCYQVTMTTKDGSSLSAYFKLK